MEILYLQALRASLQTMLGIERCSNEEVGGTVIAHVPAELFSVTSGTITDVSLRGHSLLWKDQTCLMQMT